MKHAFCLRFAYSMTMEYSVARKAFIITLILYMPWNQDDVTELYGQSVLHNKEGYDSLVCAYISKAVA